MINILIPMAGLGSRFQKVGYKEPKPLIPINGKPMIERVIDSLNLDGQWIFVVQQEHIDKYHIDKRLKEIRPNSIVVPLFGINEGAACSLLAASDFYNDGKPLVICNCDNIIHADHKGFLKDVVRYGYDGGIETFTVHNDPKWSFVKVSNGLVTEVAEKIEISCHATAGLYIWRKGENFIKYANRMIEKNIRVNNEFYTAPVYNQAIEDHKKIIIQDVYEMWGVGTPEDLEIYLKNAPK